LAGLKTIGWFGGYTLPCGGMQPSIGPPGGCIPGPGGIGPPVPGIIWGRGPIGMPGGQGWAPGMQPVATVPPGMQTAGTPGIIGGTPRGGLMPEDAEAENGDAGGMSVTGTPAETRPPTAVTPPLLAIGGISSKPPQETGISGAVVEVSLTGLNISATSDSLYTTTTRTE